MGHACSASVDSRSGLANFDAVSAISKRARTKRPQSNAGREQAAELSRQFGVLRASVRQRAVDRDLGLQDVADMISSSAYLACLGRSRSPVRRVDLGWIALDIPDNGEWHVEVSRWTGVVRVDACLDMLSTVFFFSFAPMASQVDSPQYAEMFRARLADTFQRTSMPIIAGDDYLVLAWEQGPLAEVTIGGLPCYEWLISSTNDVHGARLEGRQLEARGIRLDALPTSHGYTRFGFNASFIAPTEAAFAHLLPLWRDVLLSVRIADSEMADRLMHRFWAGNGPRL